MSLPKWKLPAFVLLAGLIGFWGSAGAYRACASGSAEAGQRAPKDEPLLPTACIVIDIGPHSNQIYLCPLYQGDETVLDAIASIPRLPVVTWRSRIWVERPGARPGEAAQMLPVDWIGITQRGQCQTNYLIRPGDRVYFK
jgi:hypothetical protein